MVGLNRRALLAATAAVMAAPYSRTQAQERRAMAGDQTSAASAKVAKFVVSFNINDVPDAVVRRGCDVILDTIGVALAGSREEAAHLIQGIVKTEASAPRVGLIGTSIRASPQLAALANGVAAHAMDYDFTYMRAQSIAPVIPAILAVAEAEGSTPRQVLEAFIVGAEVAARFVRANQDGPMFDGWHSTGMVGVMGAAAGCAKLLNTQPGGVSNTMGIAASLASGITANFGTMTKPLHCGNAARNAVLAAYLGRDGYSSNDRALDGRTGYFNTFGRGLKMNMEGFDDFGHRFDLVEGRHRFKPYPCGGLTHTAIEAGLELRNAIGSRASDIKAIHCFVTARAAQRAGADYPRTVEAAKFSLGYLVPYAILYGPPRLAAFTERALEDERLKNLAARLTASVDKQLGDAEDDSPARIQLTMSDGSIIERRKDFGSGSNTNPMSAQQMEDKFFDCATQVIDRERAQRISEFVKAMPQKSSFADFWPLLRTS